MQNWTSRQQCGSSSVFVVSTEFTSDHATVSEISCQCNLCSRTATTNGVCGLGFWSSVQRIALFKKTGWNCPRVWCLQNQWRHDNCLVCSQHCKFSSITLKDDNLKLKLVYGMITVLPTGKKICELGSFFFSLLRCFKLKKRYLFRFSWRSSSTLKKQSLSQRESPSHPAVWTLTPEHEDTRSLY